MAVGAPGLWLCGQGPMAGARVMEVHEDTCAGLGASGGRGGRGSVLLRESSQLPLSSQRDVGMASGTHTKPPGQV